MIKKRKNSQNLEEPDLDVASHPESGMFRPEDGHLVQAVRFESKEIRGHVSHESYETLIDIWGAKGLDKAEGLRDMVNRYITDIGNLQLTERSERIKSEEFGVSPQEVRSKKREAYKDRGKGLQSRLRHQMEDKKSLVFNGETSKIQS